MKLRALTWGLLLGTSCCSAYADWVPVLSSRAYNLRLEMGDYRGHVSEDFYSNGSFSGIAREVVKLRSELLLALNQPLSDEISKRGGTFLGGVLQGDPVISVVTTGSGGAIGSLSGISYVASAQVSGKKFGVVSFTCTTTLRIANIFLVAKYGSFSKAPESDKFESKAEVDSSTDCDSNISWIPFADFLINKLERNIDSRIEGGVEKYMTSIRGRLLFKSDQSSESGLEKLIPRDAVIQKPDGTTFPIGQYVNDNLRYLIDNSSIEIRTGQGLQPATFRGYGEPQNGIGSGNVLKLKIASPAISFSMELVDWAHIRWKWSCARSGPRNLCGAQP